jgi:hypothetical protein
MGELNDLEFPNYSDKLPVLRIIIRTASLLIIRLLRLAINYSPFGIDLPEFEEPMFGIFNDMRKGNQSA